MSNRTPILLLLGALTVPGPGFAAEPAKPGWPEALYNPKADKDDLVLPMPCGGAMTFRKVAVPAEGALDDRRVELGGGEAKFAYSENSRRDWVGGGFTDPKAKNLHAFYIGKYEVTRQQYAALSGSCAEPGEEARLPKVQVTWAEAVAFAGAYSTWLVKNALDRLPAEDGAPGFVRLPTEAEWEFAARGGIAVSDSVFVQPSFPMPEGAASYVWYQGSESANNELNAIGLLKPNPLGLYDMLGNAGEFVLDPFRLNKLSRLHGQAGGQTVKGGDFRTPLADIRSAAREEFVPTDKRGERRSPSTGFRLALAAPSLPSTQRIGAVRKAWEELPKAAAAAIAGPQDDPVKEVEVLGAAVEDPALKQRIRNLSTVIKSSIQTSNEQRARAARSEIRVGAYLARKLADDKRIVATKERQIEALSEANQQLRDGIRRALETDRATLDFNLGYYIDTLTQLNAEYPEALMLAQAEVLKREFEARNLASLNGFIDLCIRHAARLRADGKLDHPKTLGEIPVP
ncbi:SUMF1/EgtB/PvdO family nonheme iron enzyme [Azospirillum sp. B506]|uniref:formylglycine-generating enzyme family protein n=1 Tax=Azospirillum sp. B506 TaxID=137721 RepID=UPI0003457E34|nr:SUMF1/EgtB/PvdO family nonheme iron enzyme [Azospirillum sp. B506]